MHFLSTGYKNSFLCRLGKSKIPLSVDMLPDIEKIKCLSLGFCKGVAVYNDGSVIGWGDSLASKNPKKDDKPYKIDNLSNIVTAKSGYLFDIFLDNEGNVFYLAKLSQFVQKIQIDEPITDIFGYYCAYVISKSGNLYQIQNNDQTAKKVDFQKDFINFDQDERIQNVVSTLKLTIILTSKNRVFELNSMFPNKLIEIKSLKNKNISKIDGMYNSIVALSKTGEIYVNGSSKNGQIGLVNMTQTNHSEFIKIQFDENVKIVDFAVSHSFSLFLDENGILWSTGTSSDGCLLQDSDVNQCQVPTKVTMIKEKVSSILCGSCFCFIQFGGLPLSKNSILKTFEKVRKIEKENKKRLSLKGIASYLEFANMNEFHFLFNNNKDAVSMNRLFADFISPKVSQFHFIDPTIDSLVISNKNDRRYFDAFNKIVKMAKGEAVEITVDELSLFAELSQILSNDDLFESIFKKFQSNLNILNIFSFVELEINHFLRLSESTKNFLTENFYLILKNYQKEFCNLNLDDETLFDILSDDNLVIEDEDSLYVFVSGLIKSDNSNIFLLECIEFQLLGDFYLKNFIYSFDTDEITAVVWRKIIDLLNPAKSFDKCIYRYKKYSSSDS